MIRYEFTFCGYQVNTSLDEFDLRVISSTLGLRGTQRTGLQNILGLFQETDSESGIALISSSSSLKPFNREEQRSQADHYKTRRELENVSQDRSLVQKLIDVGVLSLHQRWEEPLTTVKREKRGKDTITTINPGCERHPEAPYRINARKLYELEHGTEPLPGQSWAANF